MTLAEIRTAVRNITKEWQTDAGTVMPSDNTILDFYINWAVEDVVLQLVPYMPEDLLTSEDISLEADENEYDLTAEWIQIWKMARNVDDQTPRIIPYRDVKELSTEGYVGETAEHPRCWYLKGTTIVFWPTPSTDKTDYARCWIVAPEAASMVSGGPAALPRLAHKLIVLQAAILIATMCNVDAGPYQALYVTGLKRVIDSLGLRVQQQPQFLRGSVVGRHIGSGLDPTQHDMTGFFD